tara:strand:- start:1596 stop:2219 length:624 start_codon:yes stop_codon:yes gene_type:complete
MLGKHFVAKCLSTDTVDQPWQHQEIVNSLPQESFDKLRKSCEQFLDPSDENEMHYRLFKPQEFREHNIDFYDEMYDLGREILQNAKQLCEKYSRYRWFDKLSLNGHISVTPPLPYKFHIHQEGLEKIWSSVTYITPDKNVGTKMYTQESADSFVREAEWLPNNTFIFCGEKGRTWHSYESGAETNRITLNFFLMKDSPKNYLRHGDV